jgi:dolichol-phosphate mannosyltransferase
MTAPGAKLVSLVVPLLDEAENAEALARHLCSVALANPGYSFEIVAVDDGSTDDTLTLLKSALAGRLPLVAIRLSRNFGSHYAISAGLDHARGEAAVIVGADMQEPVDLVSQFIAAWQAGAEVVWGIRRSRAQGRGIGTRVSRLFSRLFHRYSEIEGYPAEGPSGVLVARPVIDAVNGLKERHRNVLGLIAWVGFDQTRVEYDQLPRNAGATKWTTGKLLKLGLDSFVQFSYTPIRLAGLLGVLISGLGFIYAVFITIRAFAGAGAPEGWTTVIVLVLFLGGIQLIVLAIFGEYLWRATDEARDRPVYVVRQVERTSSNAMSEVGRDDKF